MTNLKFTKTESENVHINSMFIEVDGLGGKRAYAEYPSETGSIIIFDEAELWTLSGSELGNQTNLLLAATHEIGHALGLPHSEKKTAFMMRPGDFLLHQSFKEVRLNTEDIQSIQTLYGLPAHSRPSTADVIDVDLMEGDFLVKINCLLKKLTILEDKIVAILSVDRTTKIRVIPSMKILLKRIEMKKMMVEKINLVTKKEQIQKDSQDSLDHPLTSH